MSGTLRGLLLAIAIVVVALWLVPGPGRARDTLGATAPAPLLPPEAGPALERLANGIVTFCRWLAIIVLVTAGIRLPGRALALVLREIVGAFLVQTDERGLYPASVSGWLRLRVPDQEVGAQTAAATASAFRGVQRIGRVGNSGAGRLPALPKVDPLPQLTAPAPELAAGEVVDVDPVERPHWLIVGQTGSGKSTALRYVLQALAARAPCEFVICEPGGVDWNAQAAAWTEHGIAGAVMAVYTELERRQDLLRAADVGHVSQLAGVPYLYLVIEEMEAVLDNLRDLDRRAALDVRVRLRNIARLGRKAGVGLAAVTQAARLDVFDAHVRENMPNLLLFRGSQGTARVFGVDVDLAALPTGTAYSVAHGRQVVFPRAARPALPAWSGYREGTTEAAPVPVEDWPRALQPDVQPVVDPTTTNFAASQPLTSGWQPEEKLEAGRAPTPEQAEWIRQNVKPNTRRGINWATDLLWGYGDPVVDQYVKDALEGRI